MTNWIRYNRMKIRVIINLAKRTQQKDWEGWLVYKTFGDWCIKVHPNAESTEQIVLSCGKGAGEYWISLTRAPENCEGHIRQKDWAKESFQDFLDAISFFRNMAPIREKMITDQVFVCSECAVIVYRSEGTKIKAGIPCRVASPMVTTFNPEIPKGAKGRYGEKESKCSGNLILAATIKTVAKYQKRLDEDRWGWL